MIIATLCHTHRHIRSHTHTHTRTRDKQATTCKKWTECAPGQLYFILFYPSVALRSDSKYCLRICLMQHVLTASSSMAPPPRFEHDAEPSPDTEHCTRVRVDHSPSLAAPKMIGLAEKVTRTDTHARTHIVQWQYGSTLTMACCALADRIESKQARKLPKKALC
jgi:hypothetical protein